MQQKPETRAVAGGGGGTGREPHLIKLVGLHALVMFLVFQQWLFMKVFDKGKVLENFLSSNEQNCGLGMCEVLEFCNMFLLKTHIDIKPGTDTSIKKKSCLKIAVSLSD